MYVSGNAVINSMFDGVELLGGTGTEINNNTVDSPGTGGFLINSYGEGNATFTCNTALNIPPGQTAYANDAGSNFTASGSCNVGFTIP
jgi:hypothetical protein